MATGSLKPIAAAFLVALIGWAFKATYDAGANSQRMKAAEADNARANDIRDRVDDVRVHDDDVQFRD